VIIAAVITILYAGLAVGLDRQATRDHERQFNQQQALQVQLSAQSIEDHYAWVLREMNIAGSYFVPAYLTGSAPENVTQVLAGATNYELYTAEEHALAFYATPALGLSFYRRAGETGQRASDQLGLWVKTYWEDVRASATPFVPPFYISPDYQFYGLLLPVYIQDDFAGILGVILDFTPILAKSVLPIRPSHSMLAWAQDSDGFIIYSRHADQTGLDIAEIAVPYASLQQINRRFATETIGQGEYEFRLNSDEKTTCHQIAWATVNMGNQHLTVVLAAPTSEINADIAVSRWQSALLGLLLAATLFASGGLYYISRQRALEHAVAEHTRELKRLNDELDQRIQQRTRELDQERAQLRTILEALEDGVLFREKDQLVYANPAVTRLLGYSRDELLSRPHEILKEVTSAVTLPSGWQQEAAQTPQKNQVWRQELRIRRKDGVEFDASLFISPVCDTNGQPLGVMDIIRDISREKMLQAHRDQFITNAAHELRRPLTNLKARLYLLSRQPHKAQEHIEIIQMAADDMAELVQDLVDLAHFSTHAIQINRRNINLPNVLRSALEIQQGHAFRLRVQINSEIPDYAVPAHADYQRLTQTFNYLIAHAIRSTAPDGNVSIRFSTQANRAVIEITDDGTPLDPAQLSFIFEPFFHPSEGNVRRTGMELALARQIIEQHGGQIVARSNGDHNSFIVQLPVLPTEPA
jgi:PAS domain S-box-containing protein